MSACVRACVCVCVCVCVCEMMEAPYACEGLCEIEESKGLKTNTHTIERDFVSRTSIYVMRKISS